MDNQAETESTYLKFLPSLFRETAHDRKSAVIGNFLKIFEKIFTGINDNTGIEGEEGTIQIMGISETIDSIAAYFHPDSAPTEFVDWLASWLGLALKEDWTEKKRREVIAKIIPIFRMRGTKKGLEEYLKIYVDGDVAINDDPTPFQIGVNSKIGINTVIGGLPTHFFVVDIILAQVEPKSMQRKLRTVETIIEMEKPAHTRYRLRIRVPSLRIELNSTIGIDTLLWST